MLSFTARMCERTNVRLRVRNVTRAFIGVRWSFLRFVNINIFFNVFIDIAKRQPTIVQCETVFYLLFQLLYDSGYS